ncbi:TPA: SDH family Clp fold serine proteinase [Legionella pneumophila]|uniref:SppA protein n=1 Tax=Legionella pneumophila TaxID=446 RepID=A0A378K768_LEGPN|nr:hypothetical protein [Legionella pneumophila]MCZ4682037.1 hypothetical protein [Legionella pneumophila]MCZ4689359.1 hypothetical protein [Legionella pneumophila]MCZ4708083.1 hypothetical protein [Legionella pneumophila]MCZ4717310.1 hypothetical protein [Legionella pneumophila]MCZ4738595.1 hypothetical protein [Legionella pneumophila]
MSIDIFAPINKFSDANQTDIALYYGDVSGGNAEYIIDQCRERKLRKNVILILSTHGGDPNAAYKISRCFQIAYNTVKNQFNEKNEKGKFSIIIDSICKSAGTLLCIGADELIMSGNGELGPIDIQLLKEDEISKFTSGLTPIQSVNFLEGEAERMFRRTFASLKFSGMNFSTKMAAQIATDITTGLLSPIFGQIDPIRIAEVDRSLRIAQEYGFRLNNGNLKEGHLEKLISGYPSHSFVIDREETKLLFNNVLNLNGDLREISNICREIIDTIIKNERSSYFNFLSNEPTG